MTKYRLTTSSGGRFLTIPTDTYVGKSLELYGEWSHGEVELLAKVLRPSDNVVEVGSNIGAHTVYIARDLCPQGQVHAFEPRRKLFQLLCANLALNDVGNAYTYQLALGSEARAIDEAGLPDSGPLNAGAFSLGALAGVGEHIDVVPLDSLLDRLPPIAVLKADAEGHEIEVLRGAAALIARDRPILYLENDRPALSEALILHVMELGYDLYWHVVRLFRRDNHALTPHNIFGNVCSFNMACFPTERKAGVGGLDRIVDPAAHPLARDQIP